MNWRAGREDEGKQSARSGGLIMGTKGVGGGGEINETIREVDGGQRLVKN